jgi:hypothetical protein
MKAQMHLAIDVSWTQVETTWREPGARVGSAVLSALARSRGVSSHRSRQPIYEYTALGRPLGSAGRCDTRPRTEHHDSRANLHSAIEVDRILIGQPDAAR